MTMFNRSTQSNCCVQSKSTYPKQKEVKCKKGVVLRSADVLEEDRFHLLSFPAPTCPHPDLWGILAMSPHNCPMLPVLSTWNIALVVLDIGKKQIRVHWSFPKVPFREGWRYQIWWIFRKKSKRPSTPPPSFWSIMFQIVYDRYCCIYARRYDGQIVWNACTWFPEIGTILRGEGWGSTAVWNLSENSSNLVAWSISYLRLF